VNTGAFLAQKVNGVRMPHAVVAIVVLPLWSQQVHPSFWVNKIVVVIIAKRYDILYLLGVADSHEVEEGFSSTSLQQDLALVSLTLQDAYITHIECVISCRLLDLPYRLIQTTTICLQTFEDALDRL
jgi:hypothetical protein